MLKSSAIKCLGKTFASEDERRDYFRNELRKKLPELKKIEGFPIGEDEDIIALSDPPYFTACPNPWLNYFIAEWEKEKETTPGRKKNFTVDEPYASDVSEGKNNPIYNAHSYHTKVPHPAIMRYILHYTQPGDIIFDGFAGTGMTGVAAKFCGFPDSSFRYLIDQEWSSRFGQKPIWGFRKAICGDLSPVASLIADNYNRMVDVNDYSQAIDKLLELAEKEIGWIYSTTHTNGRVGKINYVVWSDVFVCPECNNDIVFWEVAVDKENKAVLNEFKCPSCKSIQTKKSLDRKFETKYDDILKTSIRVTTSIPVLINYSIGGKRFEKRPDREDIKVFDTIEAALSKHWFPSMRMPEGDEARRNDDMGITHVHQFFTNRNLLALSYLLEKCKVDPRLLLTFNSISQTLCSKLVRYNLGNRGNGTLSGTLYISSLTAESNALKVFEGKSKDISKAYSPFQGAIIYTESATDLTIESESIDYIFTDPPFGANIMYSDLNFLWEAWLKVFTNNKAEAIECKTHNKSLLDYQELMTKCFKEYYRILKPGKWMTVEFSNTSAAVWNGIQTSLQRAGFIIGNVAALDKQQGSFKAVTTPTAVKQDLVISCYKSTSDFDSKFLTENNDINVWTFIEEHLKHLPVSIIKDKKATAVIERSPKILYDRLISFYLMRGLPIPIDAVDFQSMLKQKCIERDGMYFTSEQAREYDEQKAKHGETWQLSLFDIIYSENDAIQWLKERLRHKPQTYQDIMPEFRKANPATRKGEREIELKTVLEENFIQDASGRWRVPDMNEAKDREALRTKSLLKEFDRYIAELSTAKTKKLKEVRVEALRAGFKSCWEKKDFNTIISMGDKIPQNLLLEDEQLLMFYDIAKDRV